MDAFSVIASKLNIRTGPGPEYEIVGTLNYGDVFVVLEKSGNWYRYFGGWVSADWVEPVGIEKSDWERSLAFTARHEGGYQAIYIDKGNWTGCAVGAGELKGTNWGVSACSYPNLDIKNLTRREAHEIFKRDFWIPSGAADLSWPACLLVFDTAILHGVGTAKVWLAEVGPNPYIFAAKRLRVYPRMENWTFWGEAWVLRVADLLEEMAK